MIRKNAYLYIFNTYLLNYLLTCTIPKKKMIIIFLTYAFTLFIFEKNHSLNVSIKHNFLMK